MEVPQVSLNKLMYSLSDAHFNFDRLFLEALCQAQDSHGAQKRDDGSSYLERHVYPVTLGVFEFYLNVRGVINPLAVEGSLLHDVLEDDKKVSDSMFRAKFGDVVFGIVKPVTKSDYHSYRGSTKYDKKLALNEDYFVSLEASPDESKVIKLEDRINNIICSFTDPVKINFYIMETEKFYLPFAKKYSEYHYNKMIEALNVLKCSG